LHDPTARGCGTAWRKGRNGEVWMDLRERESIGRYGVSPLLILIAPPYKPHSWLGTTGGLKGVEYRCQ